MTVHAYNHSNIITMTIIITATKIGELLWCCYNNMVTTILILVGYTIFYHQTKFWPYLRFAYKTLHASKEGLYIIILKVSSPYTVWKPRYSHIKV